MFWGHMRNDNMLSNKLQEWAERLGLQEWRISLHDCVPAGEMKDQNCAGCVDWQEVDKSARIEIIDPDDYGERVIPFDYEITLLTVRHSAGTTFLSSIPINFIASHKTSDLIVDMRSLADIALYESIHFKLMIVS